ncbi:nucleotide exchange factor GrpE [Lujinxingia litoralis]|uniref:nucleotide exchange factor GrpE n=1 Tax=Lujinxingia litoralis TaxID=2211119 RepID=UPI001314891A|nr:nucleotide exchange factor GrpE [Lujinxingia litoralis]
MTENEKPTEAMDEPTDVTSSPEQAEVEQEDSDKLDDDLFLSPDEDDEEVIVVEGGDDDSDAAALAEQAALQAKALEEANARIDALAEERDEVKNKLMRSVADLENYRRRVEREKEDLRKYGIDKVVSDLIPAVDNFERALQHADGKEDPGGIVDGVTMIYKQIINALAKYGVQGFVSKGEPFDPQRHEAIQQVETTEFDTGTVVEEYQKGYFLHDRLLRPAMVAVAKRIEAPQTEESGDTDGEDDASPEGGETSQHQD